MKTIYDLRANSDDRIRQIFDLINCWQTSNMSIPFFCKIIGVSPKTFSAWKSRFTPSSPKASQRWMELGGVINYQHFSNRYQIELLRKKWIDYCNDFEEN